MAIEAGNVVWNITADNSGLDKGLKDSEAAVASAMTTIGDHLANLGAAFTALGATITGALGAAVFSAVEFGGQIQDAADKTGIGTESLQKLKFAAEQSGTSFETLQGAIYKMNNGLAEAVSKGTGPFNDALKAVGLNAQSLVNMNTEERFMAIAQAFSAVQDPAVKTAIAMDLFGKSGADLVPTLSLGAAGIQELGQQAQDLGLIIGGDAISNAEAFGDQWDQLKLQMQGIAMQIGTTLIPVIQQMLPAIQEAITSISQWISANPQLTATIGMIAGSIGALMLAVGPLLMMIPGLIAAFSAIGPAVAAVGVVIGAMSTPVLVVVAAIGALIAAGIALYQNWDAVKQAAQTVWAAIIGIIETAIKTVVATIILAQRAIKSAIDPIVTVLEMGAENMIAAIMYLPDLFTSIWSGIVGAFAWVYDKVSGFWNGILAMIDSGIEGVAKAINWLAAQFGVGPIFGDTGGMGGAPPGRAVGGPVTGGMPYVVGERGQELFIPDQNGRIVPNNQLGGMGGNNVTINVNGYNRDPRSLATEISRIMASDQLNWARV